MVCGDDGDRKSEGFVVSIALLLSSIQLGWYQCERRDARDRKFFELRTVHFTAKHAHKSSQGRLVGCTNWRSTTRIPSTGMRSQSAVVPPDFHNGTNLLLLAWSSWSEKLKVWSNMAVLCSRSSLVERKETRSLTSG